MSGRYGIKCVWNKKKESCEPFSADVKKNSLEMCELSSSSTRNSSLECGQQASCHACLATALDCVWCSDGCHEARCPQKKDVKAGVHYTYILYNVYICPDIYIYFNAPPPSTFKFLLI
jgi:hypothetical protein